MALIATPPTLIVDHAQPPPGTWEREASHFPAPVSPFTKSLMLLEDWSRRIAAETGSMVETIRLIEIGGWVYLRAVPFGERPGAPRPPAWLVPLMMRLVPAIRRRTTRAQQALDGDWSGQQIDTWYRLRDDLAERISLLRRTALSELTDDALDEHTRAVIAQAHECLELHFRLHGAVAHRLRAFCVTCQELLGWDDRRSLAMLTGTSVASTESGRALFELARIVDRSAGLAELVADAEPDRALAASDEFARAFADYLESFCFRALTYDVSDPILAERPELVLSLVRDQVQRVDRVPSLGDGSPAIEEARTLLAGAMPPVRARFEDRLSQALLAYPVREDNAYLTVCAPYALLRMVGLELGRRLVERGQIDARDDVFALFVDEARSAVVNGDAVRHLVRARRQERLDVLARPGPQRYGPEPTAPPALDRMPPAARESIEDLTWLLELVTPPPGQVRIAGESVITGLAAARGTARGPVRIVRAESEFDKLRAGDVLVCECTSPAWSILFPSLSAVVTDSGGILSHPAIVAREFGIPAVVATGDATSRLRDGQLVVVNGSAGSVRVLS